MFYSFMVSTVRLLGRYQGRDGQIEIIESWDGTRVYFEGGVRQSQATLDGESVFTYVKIMDELLSRPEHILVLGCGGGNLATRLWRLGKKLTIVDINPLKRPPEGLLCAINGLVQRNKTPVKIILIRSPHRRGRAASLAFRGRALSRS
jgi:hypothetical protein